MGFILVEQTQTSVEHTKFSLLYFVEHNQTMPEWKYEYALPSFEGTLGIKLEI